MGRRNHRSSMGDAHVNDAIARLCALQQKTVALLTHYQPTHEKTLQMLFPDDTLAKLEAVRGMVRTMGDHRMYEIAQGVKINIDFEGASVPAIEPEVMSIDASRIQLLLDFTAAVTVEHNKFEALKGALRWLNRNATPGAIRYFFPQAMKLVPTSPIWRDLQEVPSRYSTPPDYGIWSQVLRDAANTVAATMLLPNDAQVRQRKVMWLTFAERSVCLDPTDSHKQHYRTDLTHYNF